MPDRTNILIFWQNPANITNFSVAGGYNLVEPASQNWWVNTAPASDSVSISRDADDNLIIFIWGPAGSFSCVPTSSILVFDNYTISGGTPIEGLKIYVEEQWRSAMIIEEVGRAIDANPTTFNNTDLIDLIIDRIGYMIPRGAMLSKSEIKGLYGELVLFERLINLANINNISHQAVLDSWKGYIKPTPNAPYGARRDFSRTGVSTVIEVKTTGDDNRQHSIDNYLQLREDTPPEHLYLFSVSAKNDATGNDSLPEIVERICGLLSPGHRGQFEGYLANYGDIGYRRSEAALYSRDSELLLTNQFNSELYDLRTVDYFTGEPAQFSGNPPTNSTNYKYTLDLTGVSEVVNTDTILLRLIQ